ncbi:MAG TPA: hypothetical protein VJT78_03010 [Candidatus Dormibacteraeota bacterium]|nr:hypothetical protein [Candidatus Dormibacteraeota bacterium]
MSVHRQACLLAITSIVIAACGAVATQPSAPSSQSSTPSAGIGSAPTPPSSPQLDASVAMAYTTAYGRSADLHCPHLLGQDDRVVLAEARLQYSSDEISRIAAPATDGGFDYRRMDATFLANPPGAATGEPPRLDRVPPSGAQSACVELLNVTNTGHTTIQLPRVGLRLTGKPVPNSFQYRLVDFCSVLQVAHYCGPAGGAGPADCSVYEVVVALNTDPYRSDFLGVPVQFNSFTNQPCPEVTLAPGRTVTFVMTTYSATPTTYRAVPVLDVVTSSARGTVAFDQFGGIYAFADPSQFACYKLVGTSFVLWEQGAASLDVDANALKNAWCP